MQETTPSSFEDNRRAHAAGAYIHPAVLQFRTTLPAVGRAPRIAAPEPIWRVSARSRLSACSGPERAQCHHRATAMGCANDKSTASQHAHVPVRAVSLSGVLPLPGAGQSLPIVHAVSAHYARARTRARACEVGGVSQPGSQRFRHGKVHIPYRPRPHPTASPCERYVTGTRANRVGSLGRLVVRAALDRRSV